MTSLTSAHTGVGEAVPTRLLDGRYRLERIIGRGGMGAVYAARDERLHRAVAVKVLRDTPGTDARRFHTEVETLAPLSHPNLVRLLDAGDDEGRPYFVMDLIDGPTLSSRLASGSLPPREVAAVGSDIAAALAYVHDAGFVHRDVKPANVLLDRTGGAKLADFGIARLADATGVTETGLRLGTPAYLAPEQVQGHEAGPGADVYALGLVLIECLSGHRAFDGTPAELAAARLDHAPEIPAALDADWQATLAAMTETIPRARISASAAAASLGLFARSEVLSPTVPGSAWRVGDPTVVMPRGAVPSNLGDTKRIDRVGPTRPEQPLAAPLAFDALQSTVASVRQAATSVARRAHEGIGQGLAVLKDKVSSARRSKIGMRRSRYGTGLEIALAVTSVLLVLGLLLGAFTGAQQQTSGTRRVALVRDVAPTTTPAPPTVETEARRLASALNVGVADGTIAPPIGQQLLSQIEPLLVPSPPSGSNQRITSFNQFVQQFDKAVQSGQIVGSTTSDLTTDVDHLATALGTTVPSHTSAPGGPGAPGHGHGHGHGQDGGAEGGD